MRELGKHAVDLVPKGCYDDLSRGFGQIGTAGIKVARHLGQSHGADGACQPLQFMGRAFCLCLPQSAAEAAKISLQLQA